MRKRCIHTKFWFDRRIRECSWLEKFVILHLMLREEMTTVGAVTMTPLSICDFLNHEKGRNLCTPELPKITEKHITKSLKLIKKRGIVDIQNSTQVTVYFYNFLKYNNWTPVTYNSFPLVVREKIPEGPIQEVVRENTIGWMRDNNIIIPEEWQ